MSSELIVSRDGDVVTAVNANPGRRNALTVDFYDRMAGLIEQSAGDGTRAMVLTGADDFFCSGGDMDGLEARARGSAEFRRDGVDKLHGLVSSMRAAPYPIIAAVEGGAAGAGFSMMLACDLVVAAHNAFVSAAYVKIGLTPDGGMTAFLAQALPHQLVSELLLTGKRMPVERLAELGVINELTDAGQAVGRAQAIAWQLAEGPGKAIAAIKALIGSACHESLSRQLELEARSMAAALGGSEAREGIAAFRQKRAPDWAGGH